MVVVGVLGAITIGYFIFFAGDSKPEVANHRVVQPASQPSPTIASREPLLIIRKQGREFGLLNEAAFLENASGRFIYDEADFKEALTSFLVGYSPEVVEIYKGNKDDLWDWILRSNPKNKEKITQYLKRGPFKVENNPEQQAMLKELIVFTKPS